jgi:SAM-dependent methyltransferase
VLGSGDNQVAFALAGLGAKVTSVDISERQIEVARCRAVALGLEMDFLRADVIDLHDLGDATFDLVYTGGHVAVMGLRTKKLLRGSSSHSEAGAAADRQRISSVSSCVERLDDRLTLGCNYFDRGPHRSEAGQDVLYPEPGELAQFEFHWTVADYITAMLASGCQLIHAEEFGDKCENWEGAPMAGLPASLVLVGRRAR